MTSLKCRSSRLNPSSTDCIRVLTPAICCAVMSWTWSAIMMFVQSVRMLSRSGCPPVSFRIRSSLAIIPSTMFRISVVAISVATLTLSS